MENSKVNSLLFSFIILFNPLNVFSQNPKEKKAEKLNTSEQYEIEMIGVGVENTKVFKIWGYGKKVDKATEQLKKNAIAACLFRGLPATAQVASTPAICNIPDIDYSEDAFLIDFFSNRGKYLDFLNISTQGYSAPEDRVKIKSGYKVAMIVQVRYNALREFMESNGKARKLDSGFNN